MNFTLEMESHEAVSGVLSTVPQGTFGYLLHDFETTYWNEKRGIPLGVSRGYPRKTVGQPETVNTYEKDDSQHLNAEWQEFYKRIWCLAAFGTNDLQMFGLIQQSFDSAMAPNRVITNKSNWIDGYMCLGMGGNIVKVLKEGRPNSLFGKSWIVETLNSSEAPPDVEEVFWRQLN